MPTHPILLRSILTLCSHLRLCLPRSLVASGFLSKPQHAFLFCPIHPILPNHFSLFDLTTLIISKNHQAPHYIIPSNVLQSLVKRVNMEKYVLFPTLKPLQLHTQWNTCWCSGRKCMMEWQKMWQTIKWKSAAKNNNMQTWDTKSITTSLTCDILLSYLVTQYTKFISV